MNNRQHIQDEAAMPTAKSESGATENAQRPSVLVTGANGFIGSFLVERFLQEGWNVFAGVRRTSERKWLEGLDVAYFDLNLSDDATLRAALLAHKNQFGAFDFVVHAAGATKCKHPDDFFRINAEGTARLARLLTETGCLRSRFVFLSSLSVFGAIRENDYSPISDTDTPQPNTAYGKSKLMAEQLLSEIKGLDYVILRPTGVYGPREKDYFLMAKSIAGHVDFSVGYRKQIITFIYVRDLVEAAYLALTRGESRRAYFLSDGGEYSSRAYSDLLQREMGTKGVVHIKAPLWVLWSVCKINSLLSRLFGTNPTLNADKYKILRQRNWKCDIQPAVEQLGYCPAFPLEKGVRETVAWYKENQWL